MKRVSISNINNGDQLVEDVKTELGGTLFNKGITLGHREVEILKAFLIRNVVVGAEQKEDDQQNEKEERKIINTDLMYAYEELASFIKKVFLNATLDKLPLLEIRTNLESVISLIDQYDILTFDPPVSDLKDYCIQKCIKVSMTAYLIAKWIHLPQKDWVQVALAGLLHDIGNTKVDSEILQKAGKLSSEELKEVRRHTIYGYNMLKEVTGINDGVKLAALQHHERCDGSGYPLGSDKNQIHLYAKIVAVADVFHAMTSSRNYKEKSSPFVVLEEIQEQSFGKLEPSIVHTFIKKMTEFQSGNIVKLNNNMIGEIVFYDQNNPTRPWVNVGGEIINLDQERHLYIEEFLKKQI
ncbi:HD-GYP domain-containing protein [Chengkuizengella axinellae]|uniref:HD-GYP domain-containing protein n=1 Tax=Chengkuizengella axinellae TaxID=3064388 RepID=A0ABT9J3M3_9BACL|nr:HD-GYP domain-containing protein [Chengkuizengella sp. 2205SS18-9]MDP5276088.1 HD-GYP domain-containing protein [Chengkuizengella sp. 2205SS18-9]